MTETQLVQSLPSIVLAVIAAFCFAGAAVLQHRAVAAEPDRGSGTLSLRGLREISRRPGWQLGLGLAAGGSTLHAIALVLAPLSVVQPVGVLAVPIAVVLAAARTHRRPTSGMVVGVIVCVTADGAALRRPGAGVRVIEAAPQGVTLRELALSPLLPEQADRADPLPDDGPVP